VQTHEMVTGGRPINAMSPETIGLTLAEGKSVLAGMQTQLVQAQADIYCQHRRECQHCGSHRDIKDWRTRRLTTLFGGSLAAYGRAAALMAEFLPLSRAPVVETARQWTLQVGARLEQQILTAKPLSSPTSARSIAVSLDSGHVKSILSYQVRSFEVM
jgi:hypothetical protein